MKTKTPTTRTGYGYGRFSSKPQERGESQRIQTDWIKSESEKLKVSLLDVFFDEAVSGKSGKNLDLELGKLLSVIQRGQVLFVHEIDRLGRQNPILLNKLIYDIVSKGVEIRVGDGSVINEDSIGELNTSVPTFLKAALAHEENVKKGKRVHQSFVNRLEDLFNHNTPLAHYGPCWVSYDHEAKAYRYDEEKMKAVRYVFKLAEQGVGINRMAMVLNQEGVKTISTRKLTKHWNTTPIQILLKNKSVYGAFESRDGRIKENHYKPIISKEEFYRVQSLLNERRKKPTGRPSPIHNLFKGLCRCSKCGQNLMMVRKHKKGKVYDYLVCQHQRLGLCKPYISVQMKPFELAFRSMFLSDPSKVLAPFQSGKASYKSKAIEGELVTVEERLKKYQKELEEGTVELTATLDKVILNLESKVKKLKTDFELEKQKEQQADELPNKLKGFFKTTSGMFIVDTRPKIEWTNEVLRSFVDHITVDVMAKRFQVVLKNGKGSTDSLPF